MVQIEADSRKVGRSISIIPTLVIGLGHFGHDVGVQLISRLRHTENIMRQEGLIDSLLVHTEQGQIKPGLIRIMELDWNAWYQQNFAPDAFLKDIEPKPDEERTTPPQQREGSRHPADWEEGKQALKQSAEHMLEAIIPLREHDKAMRLGATQQPGTTQPLRVRIFVVCAAREAASAELTTRFVELLGRMYIQREKLAKGIQLICYTGTTTRSEHEAVVQGNADAYDRHFTSEIERIKPEHRSSLLAQLETLSQKADQSILEMCYLLDTRLSNSMVTVRNRPDIPDETTVAAALALNFFITTDGDARVRGATGQRWHGQHAAGVPGIFATFGISSYSIEHPKLRQLVYNHLLSDFLNAVQPVTDAEYRKITPAPLDDALANNTELEVEIKHDIEQLINEYRKNISLKEIQIRIAKPQKNMKNMLDYKHIITQLQNSRPTGRQTIRDELDNIPELSEHMQARSLHTYIQGRQVIYEHFLYAALEQHIEDLYRRGSAPLTRIYRFMLQAHEALKHEMDRYQTPITADISRQKRDQFLLDQEDEYERALGEASASIYNGPQQRKNRRAVSVGSAALLTGIAATALLITATLPIALIAFLAVPGMVMSGSTLSLLFHSMRQGQMQRSLRRLAARHDEILQKAEQEAWEGALTKTYIELDTRLKQRIVPLCQPHGIISQLRVQTLADETIKEDQVLERVFFTKQLKEELIAFSKQLAQSGMLWNQRQSLLQEIIDHQPIDITGLQAWLRGRTELVYRDDLLVVNQLINHFLEQQTAQRLQEIWTTLSEVATPFARYINYTQDDASVPLELFGARDLGNFSALRTLPAGQHVHILKSNDPQRWTFINLHLGLHRRALDLSVNSLVP